MKDNKHIKSFNEATENLNISDVMSMLPTDKEAEKYANGYFGYPDDYEDSRVISASEQAFVSGCDWMRSEIERKLKGGTTSQGIGEDIIPKTTKVRRPTARIQDWFYGTNESTQRRNCMG